MSKKKKQDLIPAENEVEQTVSEVMEAAQPAKISIKRSLITWEDIEMRDVATALHWLEANKAQLNIPIELGRTYLAFQKYVDFLQYHAHTITLENIQECLDAGEPDKVVEALKVWRDMYEGRYEIIEDVPQRDSNAENSAQDNTQDEKQETTDNAG